MSVLQELILNPKFNPNMDWGKYYPEWFVYEVDNSAGLANGASLTLTLPVQADASFILMRMTGTLFNATTGNSGIGDQQVLDVSVSIQDTGSGKNLMSAPVQFSHLFGQSGKDPYDLPTPRVLQANSSLIVTITNNSGGALTKIFMAFQGVKMLRR